MDSPSQQDQLQRAADELRQCKALIITAGAGMGVDSGLPDFRGPEGFWQAYPPLKAKGISLAGMSTPSWFKSDPTFAWGFFGHRLNLYRPTLPHKGFGILKKWAEKMEKGYFVFTSNVDGHFQKAGFPEERVVECHGSINFMQCVDNEKCTEIWPTPVDFQPQVDESVLRLTTALPQGPPDQPVNLARPNIKMFGDNSWVTDRTDVQRKRFDIYIDSIGADPFVVIEIGSGLAVPTVRLQGEMLVSRKGSNGTLIRINPAEPEVDRSEKNISLKLKGLEALEKLDALLQSKTKWD